MAAGGLGNFGNTCYLNTSLQCLGHCTYFLKYILDESHESKSGLSLYLHEVYQDLWVHKYTIIPKKLLKFMIENIKTIELLEQNDINEFVSILIDKLNQSVAKPIHVRKEDLIEKYKYKNTDFDVQKFKMDLSWYEKTGKEYSPLMPMLHGQTISQIICGNCNKIFHNYEIYMNLMLPVTNETQTLYHCLDAYFTDEVVNADNPIWTCDQCHMKHKSVKTSRLWRNPNILVVSLKRFTHDLRKNNKKIEIFEDLDISKYCLTNNNNKYKLCAVAHHFGSFDSGHYHAVCRKDDKWFEYDDLSVREIIDPKHDMGYVFFYESVSKS